MKYITVVGSTYEEALNKARKQYGERLRVQSKKEVNKSGIFGFGKTTQCVLSCYLSEENIPVPVQEDNEEELLKRFEKEAQTPNPDAVQQKESVKLPKIPKVEPIQSSVIREEVEKAKKDISQKNIKVSYFIGLIEKILRLNEFSDSYVRWCKEEFKRIFETADADKFTEHDFELMLMDKIAESFEISHSLQTNPKRICVFLGLQSSGKTATIAKLAAMFASSQGEFKRDVRVVSSDGNKLSFEQLTQIGNTLNFSVEEAEHESELEKVFRQRSKNELILVDTAGKTLTDIRTDYKLLGLMNVSEQSVTEFYLVLPAPMKNSDISKLFELFSLLPISAIIVTKLDETSTMGNIISISHEKHIPLTFATYGKKIPKDLKIISAEMILKSLKGFNINIESEIEHS